MRVLEVGVGYGLLLEHTMDWLANQFHLLTAVKNRIFFLPKNKNKNVSFTKNVGGGIMVLKENVIIACGKWAVTVGILRRETSARPDKKIYLHH